MQQTSLYESPHPSTLPKGNGDVHKVGQSGNVVKTLWNGSSSLYRYCLTVGLRGLLEVQSIRFRVRRRCLVIPIGRLGQGLLLGWSLVLLCLHPVDCWLGILRLLKRVGISIF